MTVASVMAMLLPLVHKRLDYLKACKKCGMEPDKWMKFTDEARVAILNAVASYPKGISLDIAQAMIMSISEDEELFTPTCRHVLIDSINSKTSNIDTASDDSYNSQPAAAAPAVGRRSKQILYSIENYLTYTIWKGLREAHVNRQAMYTLIGRLLVQLGLHRPKEIFWGHLVGFVQWATESSMPNVSSDREMLKAKWNEARLTMDLDFEAPDTYPRTPDMLLLTHPAIFHRAYVGNEQPILPPSTMDADSLEILKNTTGCRSTKGCLYNDHTVRMTRHRSTLETMLVFGKLCPQRLPGEL